MVSAWFNIAEGKQNAADYLNLTKKFHQHERSDHVAILGGLSRYKASRERRLKHERHHQPES